MLQKQLHRGIFLALFIAALALPSWVQAGGWAVVSLEALPEKVMAERPFTIRFAVLQHGLHLSQFPSTVTAVHPDTGAEVTVAGTLAEDGYFEAELILPQAGQWQWQINTFGYDHKMPPLVASPAPLLTGMVVENGRSPSFAWPLTLLGLAVALWGWRQKQSRVRLALALAAVALVSGGVWLGLRGEETAVAQPPAAAFPVIAASEMGEALFVAKACIGCHQHDGITMADNTHAVGPNLSQYKGSVEFLSQWLKDPAQMKPGTLMPNLQLTNDEIEILADFLSQ